MMVPLRPEVMASVVLTSDLVQGLRNSSGLRRRLHRDGVVRLAAGSPGCVVAMEACCGAHHLGRRLREAGRRNRPASGEERAGPLGGRPPCREVRIRRCMAAEHEEPPANTGSAPPGAEHGVS